MTQKIEFSIEHGDITTFDADVVALKYAQDFHGLDYDIAAKLLESGVNVEILKPKIDDYCYISSRNVIRAPHILLLGTQPLKQFSYQEIRPFAEKVLATLADQAPNTRYLAMTIHGPGYGLDEVESALAQFAGYVDAIEKGTYPVALEHIAIVDRNEKRVQRLRLAFEENLATIKSLTRIPDRWAFNIAVTSPNAPVVPTVLSSVGTTASERAHIFVAMPFKEEMDDIFYYGIQRPVRFAGFLCERVDQSAFTGDVLEQIKYKIDSAAAVVADLSQANPNVYLEVGYAWGKGKPTILLVNDEQHLSFDVRGQKYLTYKRIIDLEESLTKELEKLKSSRAL